VEIKHGMLVCMCVITEETLTTFKEQKVGCLSDTTEITNAQPHLKPTKSLIADRLLQEFEN